MAETSGVQHFTELDFDISAIPAQLEQIERMIEAKGKDIQNIISKNWKISDLLAANEGGTGEYEKQLKSALAQIEKLKKEKQSILESDKSIGEYAKEVYKTNEKALSVLKQITSKNSSATADEQKKANVIKEQTEELLKQLQTKKKLSVADVEQLNSLKSELSALEKQSKATNTVSVKDGQTYLEKAKNFFSYRSFGYMEQGAKAAFNTIKDVETEIANISRIMDDPTFEKNSFTDSLFKISKAHASDILDTADIELRFAQAGYNVADSLKMTETALLALNTAELDADQATQSMIGIMQQWGYTADDMALMVDKINKTADNYALSSQDLVDGLLRSSSAAKNANMSFDETIGVLTAMREVTGRTGKEVGNALNSIISYMQRPGSLNAYESLGIKVYSDEAKTQLVPVLDVMKQLSDRWKAVQNSGAEATNAFMQAATDAGFMSSELAIATDTTEEYQKAMEAATYAQQNFTDVEKRDAAQASAGVFRRNYFIALMENLGKVTEVTTGLMDAQGYSAREESKRLETLEAKITTLVTQLKELAVQAGEAGLMDLAKGAVEAAGGFTQFIKGTGGLKNALTALAGVMVIVKAKKFAEVFSDIKDTISPALNGIKSFAQSIGLMQKDMVLAKNGAIAFAGAEKAVATGAVTMGTSIQAALGIIGLVTIAISAVVAVVSDYNARIDEARQKAIDKVATDKEQISTLDDLIKKYDELAKTDESGGRVGTSEELRDLQSEIASIIGDEVDRIDLANGKYEEQLDTLKGISKEKREQALLDANVALILANKNLDRGISNTGFFDIAGKINTSKAFAEISQSGAINNDTFNKIMETRDGIIGYLNNMSPNEALSVLEDWQEKLIIAQKNGKDVTNAISFVSTALSELRNKIEAVSTAQQIVNTLLEETGQKQKTAGEYCYENARAAETNAKYAYANAQAYDTTSKNLKTYDDVINDVAATQADYNEALSNANITEEQSAELKKKLASLDTDRATALKNYQSEISTLNGYIQTMNEGGTLTAEQIMSLIELYPQLSGQIVKTSEGYKIETTALEEVRNANIEKSSAIYNAQVQDTLNVLQETANRLGIYQSEVAAIQSLADAQNLLAKIGDDKKSQSKNINSQYDFQNYSKKSEIETQTQGLVDAFKKMELAKEALGKIGISSNSSAKSTSSGLDSVATSAKEAEQSLSDLIEKFDTLTEMGLTSIEEQIKYFEELERGTKLSAENIKSVQSKLHNLYKSQINEQLDLFKKAQNEKIAAIEAEYDAKIKAETDYYDKKLSMLDEEQSQYDRDKEDIDFINSRNHYESILQNGASPENYAEAQAKLAELIAEYNEKLRQREFDDRKKQLEDEKATKLESLEKEKQSAVDIEKQKLEEVEKAFNDANVNMIAAAGNYAPELYNKFKEFFTNPLKQDFETLKKLMAELSGTSPQIKASANNSEVVNPNSVNYLRTKNSNNNDDINVGSKVKVNGAVYATSNGEGKGKTLDNYTGTVTKVNVNGKMPYHIDGLGWASKDEVVKARTGGETLADGMAMLHANEFIANSAITSGLRELVVNPTILNGLKNLAAQNANVTNIANNSSNVSNSPNIKIDIKQEFLKTSDSEIATYKANRKIMREIAKAVKM